MGMHYAASPSLLVFIYNRKMEKYCLYSTLDGLCPQFTAHFVVNLYLTISDSKTNKQTLEYYTNLLVITFFGMVYLRISQVCHSPLSEYTILVGFGPPGGARRRPHPVLSRLKQPQLCPASPPPPPAYRSFADPSV